MCLQLLPSASSLSPPTCRWSRLIHSISLLTERLPRVAPSSQVRLLKLARYYEGAELLQRAMYRSTSQLLVPMFMLFIMVVCFSVLLVEVRPAVCACACARARACAHACVCPWASPTCSRVQRVCGFRLRAARVGSADRRLHRPVACSGHPLRLHRCSQEWHHLGLHRVRRRARQQLRHRWCRRRRGGTRAQPAVPDVPWPPGRPPRMPRAALDAAIPRHPDGDVVRVTSCHDPSARGSPTSMLALP